MLSKTKLAMPTDTLSVKLQWGLTLSHLSGTVRMQSCKGVLLKREAPSKLIRIYPFGNWINLSLNL